MVAWTVDSPVLLLEPLHLWFKSLLPASTCSSPSTRVAHANCLAIGDDDGGDDDNDDPGDDDG